MEHSSATASQISGAVDAFVEVLQEESGDPTMGLQQLRVLLLVRTYGVIGQAEVAKQTGSAKGSITRYIDKMDMERGLGWIDRREDLVNKRFKYLHITPKGLAVLDKAATAASRLLQPKAAK